MYLNNGWNPNGTPGFNGVPAFVMAAPPGMTMPSPFCPCPQPFMYSGMCGGGPMPLAPMHHMPHPGARTVSPSSAAWQLRGQQPYAAQGEHCASAQGPLAPHCDASAEEFDLTSLENDVSTEGYSAAPSVPPSQASAEGTSPASMENAGAAGSFMCHPPARRANTMNSRMPARYDSAMRSFDFRRGYTTGAVAYTRQPYQQQRMHSFSTPREWQQHQQQYSQLQSQQPQEELPVYDLGDGNDESVQPAWQAVGEPRVTCSWTSAQTCDSEDDCDGAVGEPEEARDDNGSPTAALTHSEHNRSASATTESAPAVPTSEDTEGAPDALDVPPPSRCTSSFRRLFNRKVSFQGVGPTTEEAALLREMAKRKAMEEQMRTGRLGFTHSSDAQPATAGAGDSAMVAAPCVSSLTRSASSNNFSEYDFPFSMEGCAAQHSLPAVDGPGSELDRHDLSRTSSALMRDRPSSRQSQAPEQQLLLRHSSRRGSFAG